jgi:hypothetical protein
MKIIFLDFDGVINSDEYMESDSFKEETKDYPESQVWLIEMHFHLDPKAIALINQLIKRTGAKVVASTTWRLHYSLEEMNKFLARRGAQFSIIDVTPRLDAGLSIPIYRGDEINAFLYHTPLSVDRFVILDDRDDMTDIKDRLVRVNPRIGLTQEDVEKAVKILNAQEI